MSWVKQTRAILPVVAFLAVLSGSCNNGNTPKTVAVTTETIPNAAQPLSVYEQYLNKLDTGHAVNASLAAHKFEELFSTTTQQINDSAYRLFERYYTRLADGLSDQHKFDTIETISSNAISLDDPGKYLAELAKPFAELKANGFRLSETEGMVIVIEDRSFIQPHFYKFVSPSMKEFLQQVKKESDEGFQEDAALLISPVQLCERTVWWEKFANTYPAFAMKDYATGTQKEYTTVLLKGMDNSPIADYDTKHIDSAYKEAYDHVLRKYPESATAHILKPYYDALLANDSAKASKLLMEYRNQNIILW